MRSLTQHDVYDFTEDGCVVAEISKADWQTSGRAEINKAVSKVIGSWW
jgi:hypothetical protein